MNKFIKMGLPIILLSNLILCPPVYADSDTEINGTVRASTIDVSASGTSTYTINGKALTSDTIGIVNNSNFPISVGVVKAEKTIGTLLDVLPQSVGNKQDWFNLGRKDSNSKIALGLKHTSGDYLEEDEPDILYFKEVQDEGTLPLGSVAAKGNLGYEINGFYGLAFSSDVSEQYKITWDISLYQDYTYIDHEADSIYVYAPTDYPDGEKDGIKGTAIIQALKTAGSSEMIVPELYETASGDLYKVVGLGNGVYAGRSAIQKITILDNIESIGQGVFQSCTGLKSVSIPDSCKTIGASAFYGCSNLESIYLPDGVELTGTNTFNQTGLKKVRLPEGMTTLPTGTFNTCKSLKMVSLPSTLETIEDAAFTACESLESLDIPASVTSFNDELSQCKNFKALYVHTEELKNTLEAKFKNTDIKVILE